MKKDIAKVDIMHFESGELKGRSDLLAVEEPLEISLMTNKKGIAEKRNISITMRTPGEDIALALGFLFTEGIISDPSSVAETVQVAENEVCIYLVADVQTDLSKIERHFYTSSSCGVCGKSSIESLRTVSDAHKHKHDFLFRHEVLFGLNDAVKKQQAVFESTGGLHASALFDKNGELLGLYEDVGRHNALDKLIGSYFMRSQTPLTEKILFLSGRACYELIQKAAMAGIQVICALGAPSSLAVELAKEFDITLIGFLKANSYNVYHGSERILR